MKNKYLITLEKSGIKTTFEVLKKEPAIKAFEIGSVLTVTKENGDQFCFRMQDYSYMSIDNLKENSK